MSEQPRSWTEDATEPLPFESLSPSDFERLCQWLVEREGFQQVEAQTTVDGFRFDLTARRDGEYWVFECKRATRLDPGDALALIDRTVQLFDESDRPTGIAFIVSGDVGDDTRELVQRRCKEAGLGCQFWYGTELDARVRQHPEIVAELFGRGDSEQDVSEKESVQISASDSVSVNETSEAEPIPESPKGRTVKLSASAHARTTTSTAHLTVMRQIGIDPSAVVTEATSDQPIRTKEQDRLGFDVYAEALASFISSEETTTPLVIGIDAPWGYGKTSLMHMIESELSPQRPWYLRLRLWLKLQWWRICWLAASIPWGIAKLRLWWLRRTERGAFASAVALASWPSPCWARWPRSISTSSRQRRRKASAHARAKVCTMGIFPWGTARAIAPRAPISTARVTAPASVARISRTRSPPSRCTCTRSSPRPSDWPSSGTSPATLPTGTSPSA